MTANVSPRSLAVPSAGVPPRPASPLASMSDGVLIGLSSPSGSPELLSLSPSPSPVLFPASKLGTLAPDAFTIPDIVLELQAMRSEIQLLREENARLRSELLEGQLRAGQKQFIAQYVGQLLDDHRLASGKSLPSASKSSRRDRTQRAVSSMFDRSMVATSLQELAISTSDHSISSLSTASKSAGKTVEELNVRVTNPLHNRPNLFLRTPRESSKSARSHELSATVRGPSRAALLANKVVYAYPSDLPAAALVASAPGYIAECGAPADLLASLDANAVQLTPSNLQHAEGIFVRLFSNRPYRCFIPAAETSEALIVCAIDDAAADASPPLSPPAGEPSPSPSPSPSSDAAVAAVASPRQKQTVLVRTAKGTDLLSMPTSGIPTLFQMSGHGSVQEVPYQQVHDDLLAFSQEQCSLFAQLKVGVLLSIGDQSEDEMFCNEHATPLFQQFLDWLARPIVLQGWDGFRGGLDVRTNTTGTTTYYAEVQDDDSKIPVLFHVSTLLPYNASDRQQLERKRHLGNDLVMIVFREGATTAPFDPRTITSHFNFVFIVVRPVVGPDCPDSASHYEVNVISREEVNPVGPFFELPPLLAKTDEDLRRLHLKLCNAERAALESESISAKLDRSRAYSLRLLQQKYRMNQAIKDAAKEKKRKSMRKSTGSAISKALSRVDSR